MRYLIRALDGRGEMTVKDASLGKGGEGSVYAVVSHTVPSLPDPDSLVVKIYHEPQEGNRKSKVVSMVAAPPDSTSVAWPLAVVYETSGNFAGYVMRKLDSAHYRQWSELSNAKDRRRVSPRFDVRYALMSCRNLVAAVHSVHEVGHVIGDINESNIFVGADTRILIVDTDSAQIRSPDGTIYPCLVGKPEYTAPEISHGSLRDHRRTVETDDFALGVAVFQMMTGGAHPCDGVYHGTDDPPNTVERIRQGIHPGLDEAGRNFEKAPRVASECIPEALRKSLRSLLAVDPKSRMDLPSLFSVLDDIVENLEQCSKVKAHWYDRRDGSTCPWCARDRKGLSEPWSSGIPTHASLPQKTLNPVKFSDDSGSTPTVRRARPHVSTPPPSQYTAPRLYPSSASGPVTPQNASYAPPQQQHVYSPSSTPQGPQNGSQRLSTPPGPIQGSTYQPEPPPRQGPPSKIKGKTVLSYADGSYGVRPPLSQLFRSNPKLALTCMRNETPELVRCWWSTSRPAARLFPLITGTVLGILISLGWYPLGLLIIRSLMEHHSSLPTVVPILITLLSQFAVITSCIATLSLFFSAVLRIVRDRKDGLSSLMKRHDSWLRTILGFVPVCIFFGPFFVLFVTVGIALLIVDLILKMFTNSSRM